MPRIPFCDLKPWPRWKRLLNRLIGWPRIRFRTVAIPRVRYRFPDVDLKKVLESNSMKEGT
jgi:hypothetical protein